MTELQKVSIYFIPHLNLTPQINIPQHNQRSHGSKSHEQHDSRFPRYAIPTVAETVTGQASLVYAVDDDHAKGREDAGDPVDEGEVEDGAVEGGLGVAGCVDEDEERD
jgi:hypothetical protein